MRYSILASRENTDDKKIAEAISEFMSPIDILVVNEKPAVYEKLASMVASNNGITCQMRPNPNLCVDYTIVIYDDGFYERYKHKK